jgi:chromosome segregation protein
MKLKQIQLQGFKSFCERTVLNFPDEITCVVGPNGCGKSNLVDAMRWVLGEQSSKQLRGGQMEDVIFHGTDDMAEVGMAEVTLVFENNLGLCPPMYADFPEIQVTRRLFRSGESEYYVNRTPCRLKDITDLFLGSGVGTKAYSIVEQGAIDKIITMKPEQRRLLIEEAAGVSKYRVRRQEALSKMEQTRGNLVRLRDIIAELARQMNSLNRQAKKAERYKQFRAELKEIELELAAWKSHAIMTEKTAVQGRLTQSEQREGQTSARLEAEEAGLESGRAELLERERNVSSWQLQAVEAAREVEKHDRALAMLVQEAATLSQTLARLAEEGQELAAREQALRLELETVSAEEAGLLASLAESEDQYRDAQQARAAREAEHRELRDATVVLEKHAQGLAAGLEKLKERIEWTVRRAQELAERGATLQARKDKLEGALEEQARTNLTFNEKLYQLRKDGQELRSSLTAREEELASKKTQAAVSADRLQTVTGRLTVAGSRLTSLREMERNFEGYERGVKAIMERKVRMAAEGKNGTYGLIAEVIKTDPQYETALEALLGERLQGIVVKDAAHGLDHIKYLREAGEGRSNFVPMSGMRPGSVDVPPRLSEMGAEPLAQRISIAGEFGPVVQALVGDALVVDDLAAAAAVRTEIGAANALVTRDGVLMDRLGVLSGGSADAFPGMLAKKRELEELAAQVAELTAEQQRAREELAAVKAEIEEGETMIARLREKFHRFDIERNSLDKDLRQGSEIYNSIKNEIEAVAKELSASEQAAAELAVESETARAAAARDEEARGKVVIELEHRAGLLAGMQAERDALAQRVTAAQVKLAALKQNLEARARDVERLTRARSEVEAGIVKRSRQREECEDRGRLLGNEREEADLKKTEAVRAAKSIDEQAQAARAEYEKQAAELRRAETAIKELYRERDEIKNQRMEAELALSQLTLQWDQMAETVQDKYGRELQGVIDEHRERIAAEYPHAERKSQRDELRDKLERMGDVNPTALEEFQEISERHSFLTNQEADLISALENLELTIGKINSTYKREFKKTFDDVNAQFQIVFPRMFKGGAGSLQLTDPENILEAGIEIMVQPPGKKMSSIVLLSGGEKALTSSALIVSLFLVRPSPFCLLDEVDAALDDVNVSRFNEMLTELARISQLIVITHNKRTMELAHTLYGVTMEKKGVSNIVSVRLKKARAMGGGEAAHEAASNPS